MNCKKCGKETGIKLYCISCNEKLRQEYIEIAFGLKQAIYNMDKALKILNNEKENRDDKINEFIFCSKN